MSEIRKFYWIWELNQVLSSYRNYKKRGPRAFIHVETTVTTTPPSPERLQLSQDFFYQNNIKLKGSAYIKKLNNASVQRDNT